MKLKSFFYKKSNDEYVEQKKTQFKIEGLYIILFLLSLNALQGIIRGDASDHVILSIGIIALYSVYYSLRKVFTGLEYPNVASQKRYRKKRKEIVLIWITSFLVFIIANIGDKLFFHQDRNWMDIIGVSSLFIIFLFMIEYFSLKKSYEKNKSLTDDCDNM